MKNEKYLKVVLGVTTTLLVLLELYSVTTHSHYKWDFIFLMLLLWGLYHIRGRINLHAFHFGLFGLFLLLHNLGTFGFYSNYYFGLEYDLYVHGFFGVVSALILYRTYNTIGPYTGLLKFGAVFALVLGMSAFHELFEYFGALLLGEGEGVLFVGAGDIDEWDTQKDMFNNLIGSILSVSLYYSYLKLKGNKSAVETQ